MALEPAGGLVVDNGAALRIADDIAPIERDVINAAAAAAFALPSTRAC